MILNDTKKVQNIIQKIKKITLIAVDTETYNLKDKRVVGFSFAFLEKNHIKRYYVPVKHKNILNLDKKFVASLLKALTNHKNLIFHNYSFDAQVLFKMGFTLKYLPHDSLVITNLINENWEKKLKKLSQSLFHHNMLTFKEVCGTGKKKITFDELINEEIIDNYASDDAEQTLKVFLYLYAELQKNPILLQVYEEIERPLLFVVADIHFHGITINKSKVKKIKKFCTEKTEYYRDKLDYFMEGTNLNSPKQLREYFINKKFLPILKRSRKTNEPSVDSEVLEKYALECKEAAWLLRYRYYSKILSTFIPALTPAKIGKNKEDNIKIYPQFNQVGTTSGRFSSSAPNFQNIPHEDKLGIRECIIAPKEYKLIGADYSQIELRLAAHFSNDPTMIKAFKENKDIHDITAKSINCERTKAKTINFGILYGVGPKNLAKLLNTNYEEAADYIKKYHEEYPNILKFISISKRQAFEQGYTETLFGRRRHMSVNFDKLSSYQQGAELRSLCNAIIQGSAAMIIKKAMVLMYPTLKNFDAHIVAQVHDELLIICPFKHVNKIKMVIEQSMIQPTIGLKVPFTINIKVGKTWDEVH